jgi:hypothetical protein
MAAISCILAELDRDGCIFSGFGGVVGFLLAGLGVSTELGVLGNWEDRSLIAFIESDPEDP